MRLIVRSLPDLERAQRSVRVIGRKLGFGLDDLECLVLVTAELGRNLLDHASAGELVISELGAGDGRGLQIESIDSGPGITDLEQAMAGGFSTTGSLGEGLPGVRRLMDNFEIASNPGGTHVLTRKWLSR